MWINAQKRRTQCHRCMICCYLRQLFISIRVLRHRLRVCHRCLLSFCMNCVHCPQTRSLSLMTNGTHRCRLLLCSIRLFCHFPWSNRLPGSILKLKWGGIIVCVQFTQIITAWLIMRQRWQIIGNATPSIIRTYDVRLIPICSSQTYAIAGTDATLPNMHHGAQWKCSQRTRTEQTQMAFCMFCLRRCQPCCGFDGKILMPFMKWDICFRNLKMNKYQQCERGVNSSYLAVCIRDACSQGHTGLCVSVCVRVNCALYECGGGSEGCVRKYSHNMHCGHLDIISHGECGCEWMRACVWCQQQTEIWYWLAALNIENKQSAQRSHVSSVRASMYCGSYHMRNGKTNECFSIYVICI